MGPLHQLPSSVARHAQHSKLFCVFLTLINSSSTLINSSLRSYNKSVHNEKQSVV
uniref:Ribulose-1 5 bisphosphate carboxylase/oxygenase large subunit N-methyltransferaseic isoform X3 n=1 Tax=Rhizophora mucronata TaxID=61149 RepID=A0A2P2KX67_RHIMU